MSNSATDPDRDAQISLTFEFLEREPSPVRAALILVDLQALFAANTNDWTWTGDLPSGTSQMPRFWLTGALRRRRKPRPGQSYIEAAGALEDVIPSSLRVRALDYGSPFHVVLEIPWQAYVTSGGGFIAAVGVLFGAPYKVAAQFHKNRQEYWGRRLAADEAKARYAFHRAVENQDVRLVEIEATPLPDTPDTHG
jgi:hypothetical protein